MKIISSLIKTTGDPVVITLSFFAVIASAFTGAIALHSGSIILTVISVVVFPYFLQQLYRECEQFHRNRMEERNNPVDVKKKMDIWDDDLRGNVKCAACQGKLETESVYHMMKKDGSHSTSRYYCEPCGQKLEAVAPFLDHLPTVGDVLEEANDRNL